MKPLSQVSGPTHHLKEEGPALRWGEAADHFKSSVRAPRPDTPAFGATTQAQPNHTGRLPQPKSPSPHSAIPWRDFPGTVACTECHRGNNAFLYAPDDPTWATVLRPEHPRPTFTTRVEHSAYQGALTFGSVTITYPRFIPIGEDPWTWTIHCQQPLGARDPVTNCTSRC